MYVDDPTELAAPLFEAWETYVAEGQAFYDRAQSEITEWRFGDDLYLPNHPLAHLYEIFEYSNWTPPIPGKMCGKACLNTLPTRPQRLGRSSKGLHDTVWVGVGGDG